MIHHIAFWTRDLDRLIEFYVSHWNGKILRKHDNSQKRSAFLEVFSSIRFELMQKKGLQESRDADTVGYTHLAIEVESEQRVDELTAYCRERGIPLSVEKVHYDGGFYESAFQDPDGNTFEITYINRMISPLL
ncbi:MAG: glyoxalase/bleomycin resistance/extradiol dioxygenase family protein [Spirochaetae bacterium HGW-Spirochaetae-2]|jgi:lactoylglutathione lyase|nr:MAG: glyoxalase/bleomycin resistance/extradiol dioxygenase family protein [Spirochaetae bacterium HGW-Spirochaetae-2]